MADDITLLQTCSAAPEQYDAYLGTRQVGYLRLRHGHFTVKCPGAGGSLVFEAYPQGDGAFLDDERPHYLQAAKRAIWAHLAGNDNRAGSATG